MSIYENGPKPKNKASKLPPQKADPKQILNDKSLTEIVKRMKNGPKSAKELLYDTDKNILGVLQRDDTPYFFSLNQVKEFSDLIGK